MSKDELLYCAVCDENVKRKNWDKHCKLVTHIRNVFIGLKDIDGMDSVIAKFNEMFPEYKIDK
jgi:hypothetical protein